MKKNQLLFVLSLSIVLVSCIFHQHKPIFGSQRHGVNKVIKTNQSEEVNNPEDDSPSTWPEHLTEDSNQPITETVKTNTTELETHVPLDEVQHPDSLSISEKIKTINEKLENRIERISHQNPGSVSILDKKLLDKASSHGGGAGGAVLIVIVILAILLGILLFYFIIWAIGQAIDDTAEEFGCYVATMAYGDYDHPKVKVLRNFRDGFLNNYKWGRSFISWYYRNSPGFTRFYANNRFVHFYLRQFLNVFVFLIKPFFRS